MDAVLLKAVDVAREAAIEVADDASAVGEYLGAEPNGERLLTHTFACHLPGYRGWVWAVTVARAPRRRHATLCEAHLVPAEGALLAPAWVPWAERIRPGDLEPSMALPLIENDSRLVPGFEITDEDDEDTLAIWELGLGRERVLGPEGRESAAERWYRGSHGPTAPAAIASAQPCSTCAFFVPLTGSMGKVFGACANEWSPSDGRVVSVDHGCGAHSQTDAEKQTSRWPAPDPAIETEGIDPLNLELDVGDNTETQQGRVVADNKEDAEPAGQVKSSDAGAAAAIEDTATTSEAPQEAEVGDSVNHGEAAAGEESQDAVVVEHTDVEAATAASAKVTTPAGADVAADAEITTPVSADVAAESQEGAQVSPAEPAAEDDAPEGSR